MYFTSKDKESWWVRPRLSSGGASHWDQCHLTLVHTLSQCCRSSHVVILVVIVPWMSVAIDDVDEELPLVDPFEPCVRAVLDAFAPTLPDEVDRVNTLDTKSSVRISEKKCDRVELNYHDHCHKIWEIFVSRFSWKTIVFWKSQGANLLFQRGSS